MSQESVRTVELAIEAVNTRGVDGYLAHCADDMRLESPLMARAVGLEQ